jgi:hypothetical protein
MQQPGCPLADPVMIRRGGDPAPRWGIARWALTRPQADRRTSFEKNSPAARSGRTARSGRKATFPTAITLCPWPSGRNCSRWSWSLSSARPKSVVSTPRHVLCYGPTPLRTCHAPKGAVVDEQHRPQNVCQFIVATGKRPPAMYSVACMYKATMDEDILRRRNSLAQRGIVPLFFARFVE